MERDTSRNTNTKQITVTLDLPADIWQAFEEYCAEKDKGFPVAVLQGMIRGKLHGYLQEIEREAALTDEDSKMIAGLSSWIKSVPGGVDALKHWGRLDYWPLTDRARPKSWSSAKRAALRRGRAQKASGVFASRAAG